MLDIQMIITDMDETFMYQGGKVPEENVRALRAVQEKGVKVLACTGRSWAMCDHLVRSFGFDAYAVTSNGAATIDIQTGQMFDPCVAEPRIVEPIVQAALLDGCKVDLFCGAWIHTCTAHKAAKGAGRRRHVTAAGAYQSQTMGFDGTDAGSKPRTDGTDSY